MTTVHLISLSSSIRHWKQDNESIIKGKFWFYTYCHSEEYKQVLTAAEQLTALSTANFSRSDCAANKQVN